MSTDMTGNDSQRVTFGLRRAVPGDLLSRHGAGDVHRLEIAGPYPNIGPAVLGLHQGELVDLWQAIGEYLGLAGMGKDGSDES